MNETVPALSPLREAVIFVLCVVVGVLAVPALTFMAGQFVLGPYLGSGVGGMIGSELRGLGSAALSAWIIALGPYVIVQLVRLVWNCDSVRARLWPERDTLRTKDGTRPEQQ